MKTFSPTLAVAMLVAACAAPVTTETDAAPPVRYATGAEPQLPEGAPKDARIAQTGNTYAGGCTRVLEQQLAAMPTPEGWDARQIVAMTQNEALGLAPGTATPRATQMPAPPDIGPLLDGTLPEGATCQVMFDLMPDGTPMDAVSHCTNEAYAATARESLLSMRFEALGVMRKGVITDFTLCTTR